MGLLEMLQNGLDPRNMKQVGPAMKEVKGERIPNAALDGPKAAAQAATKGGLMRVLGPAGLAYGAAEGLADSRQLDSEMAQRMLANVPSAQPEATPQGILAQPQAGPGFSAQESLGTQTQPNFSADESMTTQMVPNPQAPQAPQGLVGQQAAPQTPQQAAPKELPPELAKQISGLQQAQQQRQVEQTRQQLEAGTIKGLQTGETSVSKLAQGIVQADAQRSGNTSMTPEQTAKAVTAEVATLKSMEPSDMARYVSYALIAGGLLASILDKSGRTADAFSQSFNRQLDRNLAAGKMQFEQKLAMQKAAQEERKINIDEKDVNSKIDDRVVSQKNAVRGLDQGDSRLEISRDEVGISRQKMENDLTLGTQRNGIMAQGNALQANNQAENRAVDRERIASQEGIAARRLAAAGASEKGVPLSYKDSKEVVDQVYKGTGQKVDGPLRDQLAARLPTLQKKFPQLSQSELVRLAEGEISTTTDPAGWFTDPKVRQKKSVE